MNSTNYVEIDSYYPLARSELPRQFVLSRTSRSLPPEWDNEAIGDWHFAAHPDAKVLRIFSEGRQVGWVLQAFAYLSDGGDHICGDRMDVPALRSQDAVEHFLYGRNGGDRSDGTGLVGCWTAIILAPDIERVYLSGGQSAVYSPAEHTVAATSNLIPNLKRDEALSLAFDPLSRNSFYSFGLTPFKGVRRLLPNHFLDLALFDDQRHWPREGIAEMPASECVAAISAHSKRVFDVIAKAHSTFKIFMSAGNDSRAVLALTRHLERKNTNFQLATSFHKDLGSLTDRQAAIHLAKIARMPLTLTRRKPFHADMDTVRRHFVRIGEGHGDKSLGVAGSVAREKIPTFKLGGAGGETGRAYYYENGELPATVKPDFLIGLMRAPSTPQVVEAASKWLNSLPSPIRDVPASVLDLMYVEQRMGCWSAPGTYLYSGSRQVENVFQEAKIIELMLQLPESYRVSGKLQQDIVAYCWPELMSIPFNQVWGWLRLRRKGRHYIGRIRQFMGTSR